MNKQIIFWLWLQCCLGVDNFRMHTIFEKFDDAQQIYLADEKEIRLSGAFTEKETIKLIDKNLEKAKKMYNNSLALGYEIYSLKDKNYPKMLKTIPTPPVVIYVKGKLPSYDKLYAAIVGTRNPTKVGKNMSFSLAYNLAKNDAVIVSGGALGIDTQAHKGAIQAGGETVCVLGSGINYRYNLSNKKLFEEISQHGAVISEYPPYYPPTKYTFPKRNRIISGMSDCTTVVEAGESSGALITAKYAVKQHREVFSVPGSVDNISSQGSNLLIREGAKTVLDYKDILDWYKAQKNNFLNIDADSYNKITETAVNNIIKKGSTKEKGEKYSSNSHFKISKENVSAKSKDSKTNRKDVNIISERLTDDALVVYDTISDTPIHVDEIKLRTGLNINAILISLTELEISGLVISVSGRRYIRK